MRYRKGAVTRLYTVIPPGQRSRAGDGDDGVRIHPFGHRNGCQGFDERVRWIHVIDAGRQFLQLLGQQLVLVLGNDGQGPLSFNYSLGYLRS
jgi:hypothetical protein